LLRTRFKQQWWFYLLIIVLVFSNLGDFGERTFSTYMVILGSIYPIQHFFFLYYLSTSKKNRSLYLKRYLEFDATQVLVKVENGTETKVHLDKLVQVTESRTFFLLYYSEQQFIYIPKNSFKTLHDLQLFQRSIQEAFKEL
jgi:hypothetical protein